MSPTRGRHTERARAIWPAPAARPRVERLARLICQRGLSQRGRIEVQNIYPSELAFNLRHERCDA